MQVVFANQGNLLENTISNASFSLLSRRTYRSMFSFMEDQSPGEQDSDPASRKEPVANTDSCTSSTTLLPVLPSTAQMLGGLSRARGGQTVPWHPTTTDWTRQLMKKLWKIKGWIKSTKRRSSPDPFHWLTESSCLHFLPLHNDNWYIWEIVLCHPSVLCLPTTYFS